MASRSAAAAIGPVTRWLPGAAAGPTTHSPWHIRLLDDDHAASLVAISTFGSAIVIERTGPARRRSHQKSEMADADRPPEGGCHATTRNPAAGAATRTWKLLPPGTCVAVKLDGMFGCGLSSLAAVN